MKSEKRIGGWQCWVEVYEDYVIKTPKKREEIRESVERYLKGEGKDEDPAIRTEKMIEDAENSVKLIKNLNIPLNYLGDIQFLEGGRIKQKRARVLGDYLSNRNVKPETYIDDLFTLIENLWEYGIHEKTFKFLSNYGIIGDHVALIDFMEITGDIKVARRQLSAKKWNKPERLKKSLTPSLLEYFLSKAEERLSLENFDSHWNKRR